MVKARVDSNVRPPLASHRAIATPQSAPLEGSVRAASAQQQRPGSLAPATHDALSKAGAAPKAWYADAYRGKLSVPENKRDFAIAYPGYAPPTVFVSKKAGTPHPTRQASYRAYGDASVKLDASGLPQHPWGRQGIAGPGAIGAYGPKLAVDPIVVREHPVYGVQFLAIKRKDTGVWAFPGGKLDLLPDGALETPAVAASRELGEEAGVSVSADAFAAATIVFEGPNGDPRDTDNAWFESQGRLVCLPWAEAKDIVPEGGSDASEAKWLSAGLAEKLITHANHADLVRASLAALAG